MEKKEQLVSAAFQLFYRHGVHAVGINRVLDEAGVAKKTLYNYFLSKEELVAATVDYCEQRYFTWLRGRLHHASNAQQAVYEIFNALDDLFNARDIQPHPFHGCYFINVSAEYSDPAHPIHQQCARNKKAMLDLIRVYVDELIPDAALSLRTAEAIAILIEGAIVQAHVAQDMQSAVKAKSIVEDLFRARVPSGGRALEMC